MTQPMIYMIAGPNGAGKTTSALRLLPDFLSVYEFVNADEIAYGLNPLNPGGQAMAAERIMLERINSLISSGKSFAFETTGASHVFYDKLKVAKSAGYRLGLLFLWLPDVTFAKYRVKIRVAQGGHEIPEKDIERRYKRGIQNLIRLYLPVVDQASIIDNSLALASIEQVIVEKHDNVLHIRHADIWNKIEYLSKEDTDDTND